MYLSLFHPRVWWRIIYLAYLYLPIFIKVWLFGLTEQYLIELKNAIKKSGCVVIKFIQWLLQQPEFLQHLLRCNDKMKQSVREFIAELKKLQYLGEAYTLDKLITDNIRQNHPIISCLEIDKDPIGVGSIAQVHRATLMENDTTKEVVIKIRHPHVENLIKTDLTILYWFIRVVKIRHRVLQETICQDIYCQSDLSVEKKNRDRLQNIFRNNNIIKFPTILYATDSLIIETFCPGDLLSLLVDHKDKYIEVRKIVFRAFLEMINHGFVHGDLHDGNIICDGNTIYVIDFGIAISLNHQETKFVRYLIKGYYSFYCQGTIDGLITSINILAERKLDKNNCDQFKDILLKHTIKDNFYLFNLSTVPLLIEELTCFLSDNNIHLSTNIIWVLASWPILEAGITQRFQTDFVGQVMKSSY